METTLRDTVQRLFDAFEAKDVDAALALFAGDAVLVDPHYPAPRMAGKAAIADGLRWAFRTLRTLRFTTLTYCASADGGHAAVEVASAHVLATGMALAFQQVFVVDTRDGLVTRLQAYEPYGPNGIGGLVLGLTRLWRKMPRKR